MKRRLLPPEPTNLNLYTAAPGVTAGLETLPGSLKQAKEIARASAFIHEVLPEGFWK